MSVRILLLPFYRLQPLGDSRLQTPESLQTLARDSREDTVLCISRKRHLKYTFRSPFFLFHRPCTIKHTFWQTPSSQTLCTIYNSTLLTHASKTGTENHINVRWELIWVMSLWVMWFVSSGLNLLMFIFAYFNKSLLSVNHVKLNCNSKYSTWSSDYITLNTPNVLTKVGHAVLCTSCRGI